MEQSSSREADNLPAGKEVACILWKPEVHYPVQQHPTTGPFPEASESRSRPYIVFKIHFDITFPSTHRPPMWSPPPPLG
jgi:hypothetical protein